MNFIDPIFFRIRTIVHCVINNTVFSLILYVLVKFKKSITHALKDEKNLTEHKTWYFEWRQMHSIYFHDKIDCVCYPHFDWKFALCVADDGSLQSMINNRFGHNCIYKIPEYNIYKFKLFIIEKLERFLKWSIRLYRCHFVLTISQPMQ